MNSASGIRKVKRLLCIAPKGAQSLRDRCGDFQHWDICTVGGLGEAATVLREQNFLVGILIDCIGHLGAVDLENFLRHHCSTQWVGVVDKKVLDVPECRVLIANHLCDFHSMPVNHERLQHTIGHIHGWAALRDEPGSQVPHRVGRNIIGDSPAIGRLRSQIGRMAAVSAPVLICGESGTGKELVAKAIHDESPHRNGPFVAINCGAIPGNLIQSELFGHEKGAFTGAGRDKKGLIESAKDGTIFLDEIAEMSMDLQVNMLRFLQEKTIFRVGGTNSIFVNARVIAASHVDLKVAVEKGRFREDLYYRMNVLPITVPPLRERAGDLPSLVAEFFKTFAGEKNSQLKGVSSTAMDALLNHEWPGNVRELMNRMRHAMVLAEGRLLSAEDLGFQTEASTVPVQALDASRSGAERHAILTCLSRAGGNVSQAARDLKISRMTLYRLMEKYQIAATRSTFPMPGEMHRISVDTLQ